MTDQDQPKKDSNSSSGGVQKPTKRERQRYRSPQRRLLVRAVQISVGLYVGVLLALIALETRMVYPGAFLSEKQHLGSMAASILPGALPISRQAPLTSDGGIQTVQYPTSDGLTLSGRLLELGADKEIVLFFHGNGNKAAWLDSRLRQLSESLGANVMAAEYRGFEDDATPTERGVVQDCLAARDFLCERYQVKPGDIILYGESLGGGCAVATASQGGAKALILERTFDRIIDVAADLYPFIPIRWIMRNRYDSIARMTVYRGPLIMIHGDADDLIPIQHGRRLYDSARCERKHFIEVPGLGHVDPLPQETMDEIASTLRQFIAVDHSTTGEAE